MYNLLVTAHQGAWDKLFYQFDKSRFLEYTKQDIADLFRDLTAGRIDTLKTYPCLFAYEGYDSDVRIGFLTSIKERGRNLLVEFKLETGTPPIPFSEIKKVAPLLDIRKWEMNRTHWAIKDEDLFDRLHAASLTNSSVLRKSRPQEKPNVSRSTHPKASSVRGFVAKILSSDKEYGTEVFYRGHSDRQKYKLEPSLFRKDQQGNYLHLDNEHIIFRELIVSNSVDFAHDQYTVDKLIRMQHYSLPTRLLDITSNPLIALYFACKSNFEKEGEVIVVSMPRKNVKYFDSDIVSCLANLARISKSDTYGIDFEATDFNSQKQVKRLAHFIKDEKPFFEPKFKPGDLRKIVCVKGKQSNDRIASQSGAFLLFGLDAVLDESGTTDIKFSRVTVTNKQKILGELDLLNINESSVFPHIENSAKYIAQKYKFSEVHPNAAE